MVTSNCFCVDRRNPGAAGTPGHRSHCSSFVIQNYARSNVSSRRNLSCDNGCILHDIITQFRTVGNISQQSSPPKALYTPPSIPQKPRTSIRFLILDSYVHSNNMSHIPRFCRLFCHKIGLERTSACYDY